VPEYAVYFSNLGKRGGSQRVVTADTPKEAVDQVYKYYHDKKVISIYAVFEKIDREDWDI
jgi:hypothetical protein